MKIFQALCVAAILLFCFSLTANAIPGIINYQGTMEVDDLPYSGTGYFRFALVDPRASVLWTNDGAFPPVESIEITLADGLFNVLLGSTGGMNVIPDSAFAGEEVFLRIWFSEDGISFQRLLPDQQLVSTGFAFQSIRAANADQVDGHDYQINWPTTLGTVQAACSNDFHSIGGTDDDQPDNDTEVPDDITINNGSLYAPEGGSMVGIGTTSPLTKLSLGTDITAKKLAIFDAENNFYGFGLDSGRLLISTANLERMTITDTGAVGIGITNPDGRLHVAGAEVRIGSAGTMNFVSGNGDLYIMNKLEVDGSASMAEDTLFVNAANRRVGIGTTTPEAALHISGDSLQRIRLTSTDATGTGIQFLRTGNTYRDWRLEAGNSFQISTSVDDATSWIDFLTIDAFGKVGIGNDTPAYTLHVDGTIFSESDGFRFPDGSQQVSAAQGDGHSLDSSDGSPSDVVYVSAIGRVGIGETSPVETLHVDGKVYSSNGGFRFPDSSEQISAAFGDGYSLDAADGAPLDAVYVDNYGNVGIGDTSPVTKLQVDGTIFSSSNGFRFPDNTIQDSAAVGDGHSLDAEDGSPVDILFVDNGGEVGIADTSPDARLEIASESTIYPVFMISSTASANGDMMIVEGSGQIGIGDDYPDSLLEISASGEPAASMLSLSSDDSEDGDILHAVSNGKIGIGTNSPTSILEISAGGITGIPILSLSTDDGLADAMTVLANGRTGIGTTSPTGYLEVSASGSTGVSAFVVSSDDGLGDLLTVRNNGNVGIGNDNPQVPLQVDGGTDAATTSGGYLMIGDENGSNIVLDDNEIMARNNGIESDIYIQHSGGNTIINDGAGRVGIGTASPETRLHVNGRITCNTLKLEGGSDLAEPFNILGKTAVEPGMVVSINPERPGELKVSEKAYDRCVAGIISGAGGIEPAVMMNQDDILSGSHPVALTGRVYCLADATTHPIVPGDLLTTSSLPGHAMAVEQGEVSHGAIIGKAMTALDSGTGMVLCLVNLH